MRWSAPNVPLKKDEKKESIRLKMLLVESGNDLDVWCEKLGFDLKRVSDKVLVKPIVASFRGKRIYIVKGLLREEQVEAIAHEYCHSKYHADCIAYREQHPFSAGRDEGHAIAFAEAVLNH